MPEQTIWTALERARSSFAKGLASLQLLAQRNTDEVEKLKGAERYTSDRLTKIETQVPGDLLQRLVIAEERISDLRDSKREVTGAIRTMSIEDAKDIAKTERAKVQVEDRKARYGIVIAVIAALGSLVIQVVKWSLDAD